MVQGKGTGLDKREQAWDMDVNPKNETDDTKDDSTHDKTANTEAKHKDDKEPEEPWPELYADHSEPTQDGLHILDIIDSLTRYPEEAIVKGKGADGSTHKTEPEDTKLQQPRQGH